MKNTHEQFSSTRVNSFRPEFTIVDSSHSLQAANYCRNSRLVVNEDDLKWVANMKKKMKLLAKQFCGNIDLKTPRCRKLGDSSEMQNDA